MKWLAKSIGHASVELTGQLAIPISTPRPGRFRYVAEPNKSQKGYISCRNGMVS
jgi:hypothetical protein